MGVVRALTHFMFLHATVFYQADNGLTGLTKKSRCRKKQLGFSYRLKKPFITLL